MRGVLRSRRLDLGADDETGVGRGSESKAGEEAYPGSALSRRGEPFVAMISRKRARAIRRCFAMEAAVGSLALSCLWRESCVGMESVRGRERGSRARAKSCRTSALSLFFSLVLILGDYAGGLS